MTNSAAMMMSEAEMAREEARRLLARSKELLDRDERRPLLARALELAVRAEQMDRRQEPSFGFLIVEPRLQRQGTGES
jgi:hypothetical protein